MKNLSVRGPDQNKKTAEGHGGIKTGYEKFEISIDFFI
jgi:hypothetical protein